MTEQEAYKQHLIQGIQRQYNATLNDWSPFVEHFRFHEWPTQYHWIEAGQCVTELCYIVEGLVRVYYIDQAGNEVNQQFHQSGEIVAPVSAIVEGEACQYYIQTLEPTKVWLADYVELNRVGKTNPEWLQLEIKMLQKVYLVTARREASLLMGNAEHRYKWFCKTYPELLERLPQYHIASFLGITPVSLSRLRKQIESS